MLGKGMQRTLRSRVVSRRARHCPPIGGLSIHLSEPLIAGKDEQVVEVGEDLAMRLGAARLAWRIAGEMIALAAAADGFRQRHRLISTTMLLESAGRSCKEQVMIPLRQA